MTTIKPPTGPLITTPLSEARPATPAQKLTAPQTPIELLAGDPPPSAAPVPSAPPPSQANAGDAGINAVASLIDDPSFGDQPNAPYVLRSGQVELTDPDFHFDDGALSADLGAMLGEELSQDPTHERTTHIRELIESYPGGLAALGPLPGGAGES